MKKLITALTVCAVAGFVTAAPVTSANIVGYKADVTVAGANFTLLAPPFTVVGGSAVQIANLFTDNSNFIASDTAENADTIMVWNGSGFDYYFFSSDAGNAWASDQDSFTPTTATIPVGGGYWFLRQGSTLNTLTAVGEVITTNINVAVGANGFTCMSNPFAAELPISSITAPDLSASDTAEFADTIMLWNGSGFDYYFYSSDAGNAWASDQDSFTPTTATVPVGGGFWFLRYGGDTVVTCPVPFVL
jgi:hypothetical protein